MMSAQEDGRAGLIRGLTTFGFTISKSIVSTDSLSTCPHTPCFRSDPTFPRPCVTCRQYSDPLFVAHLALVSKGQAFWRSEGRLTNVSKKSILHFDILMQWNSPFFTMEVLIIATSTPIFANPSHCMAVKSSTCVIQIVHVLDTMQHHHLFHAVMMNSGRFSMNKATVSPRPMPQEIVQFATLL